MIDFALYEYAKTLTPDIYYGSANNVSTPYYVMYKLNDDERQVSLCQDQGDEGKALFFFDGYKGGQNQSANQLNTMVYVNTLKEQISRLLGIISFDGVDYNIWYNKTTGVIPIGKGQNEVGIYGAQFTVLLYWTKLI